MTLHDMEARENAAEGRQALALLPQLKYDPKGSKPQGFDKLLPFRAQLRQDQGAETGKF